MYVYGQPAPGAVAPPGGYDYQPPSQVGPGYGALTQYPVPEYVPGGMFRPCDHNLFSSQHMCYLRSVQFID